MVHAEEVADGAREADLAEVEGLVVLIAVEEEPGAVGGVGRRGLQVGRDGEFEVRILRGEEVDEVFRNRALEPAAVLLLELVGVGQPADDVADRPHGQLDQNRLPAQVHEVVEDGLLHVGAVPHAETERHVVLLRAEDPAALRVAGEEDVAGLVVLDLRVPRAGRQQQARAVVEVVADAARPFLRRDLRRREFERIERRGRGRRRGGLFGIHA